MPRQLSEITESIIDKMNRSEELSAAEILTTREKKNLSSPSNSSKLSRWRLIVFAVAYNIGLLEILMDVFRQEIESLIANNHPHTALWYIDQSKKFQYGFDYPETTIGGYDNTGVNEEDVQASMIISRASVQSLAGRLKIKVAKESDGKLEPLTYTERQAFSHYMSLVKDAGTIIEVISRPPDDIRVSMDVYFDPQVIDLNGARIDGTSEDPVGEAIEVFLSNLKFNGEFITDDFEDHIRAVEGVEIINLRSIEGRFGLNLYQPIEETYLSDSGYMTLSNDSSITFRPREVY